MPPAEHPPIVLTAKTGELLNVLTKRLRLLSIPQIARTWFTDTRDPPINALQTAKRLETRGLVRVLAVMAHPEIELVNPLFRWLPNSDAEPPDFGRLAYRAQARWTRALARLSLVMATERANHLVGGRLGGRPLRSREVTHELHLGQLFLRLRDEAPATAESWQPEDQLFRERRGEGRKLPDAQVTVPEIVAIEFAGAYAKSKIAKIHQDLQHSRYELW